MINKKLDDIIEDIITLKKIFNSTDYFKTLEEVIDKQNNHNKELELKINNLQSKIDKANEIIKNWHQEYNGLMETNNIYIPKDKPSLFDLRDILKEVENVENN